VTEYAIIRNRYVWEIRESQPFAEAKIVGEYRTFEEAADALFQLTQAPVVVKTFTKGGP
jgi:hypothetical protein